MSEEKVIEACSIDGLQKLKDQNKEGFFLLVSQPGCGGCDEVRDLLQEVVKDRKPIIEAGLDDQACKSVAEQLNVGMTPTVIYYQGNEEKKRIAPDGKLTPDMIREQLRELLK